LSHFRDSDGNVRDEDGVVAGIVSALDIPVRVSNIGEDAFSARIEVTFNSAFNFIRAVPVVADTEVRHTKECFGIFCVQDREVRQKALCFVLYSTFDAVCCVYNCVLIS